MKRLWTLSMMLLCATVMMAQFTHAATVEDVNCNTVKSEQFIDEDADHVSSSQDSDKKAVSNHYCDSCHLQLVTIPLSVMQKTVPQAEVFAAVPTSPYVIFPDTLSEPPQA